MNKLPKLEIFYLSRDIDSEDQEFILKDNYKSQIAFYEKYSNDYLRFMIDCPLTFKEYTEYKDSNKMFKEDKLGFKDWLFNKLFKEGIL